MPASNKKVGKKKIVTVFVFIFTVFVTVFAPDFFFLLERDVMKVVRVQ